MAKLLKSIPIIFSTIIVAAVALVVVIEKNNKILNNKQQNQLNFKFLSQQQSCQIAPKFLKKLKIPQPVLIDLSQRQYKGIAMHYGPEYRQTLHPKEWQKYENFSTYTTDELGNIYIIPTPFISIKPNTFELQKSLYKLDSQTGVLAPFMTFDDVKPSSENPYGLSTIAYDCDDHTLWMAAIDESNYRHQKGVLYHVNPTTKEILQKVEGVDALSMNVVLTAVGKYLLVGSARDNGLYAYQVENGVLSQSPAKILEIPSANERIRKIKIKGRTRLELQSIPFGYSLIAQTEEKYRSIYTAVWNRKGLNWNIEK